MPHSSTRPGGSAGRDRYGSDVLANRVAPRRLREVPATAGLVVEDAETGWCGAVVGVSKTAGMSVVRLEDRRGRERAFPLGPGFLLEGEPIELTRPRTSTPAGPAAPGRTASGSRAVVGLRAQVAKASRIWVEGTHDAELVEKIWGHDLRVEGIVVEPIDGVDNLAGRVREFEPGPTRRLGVLVDHLVSGSKETRLAREAVGGLRGAEHVLVLGHPFIDVWQAIRPERVGLTRWPDVPRGTDIKKGTLAALGWPHADQADVATGWKRILARVRSYADLDPALLAKVEELIDFVTVP
ncbi:MAG: DUF3097 domain-containing protein [Actinomycetales bacterium]